MRVRSLVGGEDPPWRRARQPIPVFLPGASHGQRSLVSYSSWGRKEFDTTEAALHACTHVPQLQSPSSRAWEPQLLSPQLQPPKPSHLEPEVYTRRTTRRSPHTRQSGPYSLQLEKALHPPLQAATKTQCGQKTKSPRR